MSELSVIRLKPLSYIHVLDNNTNVTRVEVGPKTYTRQDHEKVVAGPESMTIIPPRHFAVIMNPILRNTDGTPAYDSYGNVRLRHGDEEIRTDSEPFPLYPGEKLVGKVTPLKIIAPNSALRLRALRDFEDTDANGKAIKRRAGDEWLHAGPGTYKPKVEVSVAEEIKSTIIKPNSALKLRARKAAVDYKGVERRAGEEWLVRESGAYLPGVDEEIVEAVNAVTLTDKKALHLRALRTFTDQFKVRRKAGEEWLVTNEDTEAYIPDVYEEVVGEVKLTTLSNRQFCVVVDPVVNKTQRFGQREVRKGEISFFLRPGEKLENGIQNIHVLAAEEALLLRAKEEFVDKSEGEQPIKHQPGDRWMISGPREYIPPAEVEILERRKIIPLDQNEGIYVRDIRTGKVRAVLGSSYLLKPTEELWQKELSPIVEQLLAKESSSSAARDKTRVITLRAPHNSAVQIYDYKEKKSRVRFGPDLVHLGPDEQFSVLSLSGDKPKRPHVIKTLLLMLGPDFMTDIITVETSDHARLSLKLSYNWHFDVEKTEGNEAATKLFQVPDFVGDACKAIASQVRTAVAAVPFDSFHKNSAKIIRTAVFGLDENQKVKRSYVFPANNLVITNIDIQSVEPVDQRTRDSLQKSVQLAIDITTKSQEATAKHKAEMLEQESRGRLEKQKIQDEADSEKARTMLLGLQAECAAVEAAGNATAEAKSRATASQIEGESNVRQAKLRTEALQVRAEAELEMTKARQNHELDHTKAVNDLEIAKASSLADIESQKFNDIVKAIGPKTIQAIAQAGPEMQAKLLQGLGLKSLLVTDGNSPINLFNTAQGLISPGGAGKGNKASDSY